MKNDQEMLQDNEAILAEILMAPSSTYIENRFAHTSDAACCGGKCESGGGCKCM